MSISADLDQSMVLDQAPLAPIQRLPDEILGLIFVRCIDIDNIRRCRNTPFLLSVVARRWRAVALSTPYLWSILSIHNDDLEDVERTDIHLERSGNVPLSLFHVPGKLRREFIVSGDVTGLNLSASNRWQHLDIKLPTLPSIASIEHGDIKGRLPILRSQIIQQYDAMLHPIECFKVAPELRSVHVRLVNNGLQLLLPWSQLRDLELQLSTFDEILFVLQACPHLTSCRLSGMRNWWERYMDETRTALHHRLETLHLSMQSVQLCCLLSCLTLPALRTSRIVENGAEGFDEQLHTAEFQKFLSRSSCTIEIFSWEGIIDREAFYERLKYLSSLRDLRMASSTPTILLLLVKQVPHILCPNLKVLRLLFPRNSGSKENGDDWSTNEILSDWSQGLFNNSHPQSLQTIQTWVDRSKPIDPRWIQNLRDGFSSQGLDFAVSYYHEGYQVLRFAWPCGMGTWV